MRDFNARQATPFLAFGAGVLLLAILGLQIARMPEMGWALLCVLAMLLAFIVRGVEAPRWARTAGYACATLGGLAGAWLLLGVAPYGGAFVLALAMAPGAVWMMGASLLDEGVGRSLGMAGGISLVASAILDLARYFLIDTQWMLGRALSVLTVLLALAWFAALGRDLLKGERHTLDSIA